MLLGPRADRLPSLCEQWPGELKLLRRRDVRRITVAVCFFVLGIAAFSIAVIHYVPDTPRDALDSIGNGSAEHSSVFVWTVPSEEGKVCTLDLDIPYSDFEHSIQKNLFRCSTRVSSISEYIDSRDPYVKQVASHILSETEGFSDLGKAEAASSFVKCTIGYSSDPDLYGRDEFYALPLETLYLRRGDCEDTSVLLCSVMLAMGLDACVLDFAGHMAVGVSVEGAEGTHYALGGTDYYYCESTGPVVSIGATPPVYDGPDLIFESGSPSVLERFTVGCRALIQRIVSI